MGKIEGKVTDLSNQYKELKLSAAEKLQISNGTKISDFTGNDQEKISKFASMLQTLSSLKKQYKSASSAEEKSTVHGKVMDFTRKWLDAKNL